MIKLNILHCNVLCICAMGEMGEMGETGQDERVKSDIEQTEGRVYRKLNYRLELDLNYRDKLE